MFLVIVIDFMDTVFVEEHCDTYEEALKKAEEYRKMMFINCVKIYELRCTLLDTER